MCVAWGLFSGEGLLRRDFWEQDHGTKVWEEGFVGLSIEARHPWALVHMYVCRKKLFRSPHVDTCQKQTGLGSSLSLGRTHGTPYYVYLLRIPPTFALSGQSLGWQRWRNWMLPARTFYPACTYVLRTPSSRAKLSTGSRHKPPAGPRPSPRHESTQSPLVSPLILLSRANQAHDLAHVYTVL